MPLSAKPGSLPQNERHALDDRAKKFKIFPVFSGPRLGRAAVRRGIVRRRAHRELVVADVVVKVSG
jgi:hypothetical protein